MKIIIFDGMSGSGKTTLRYKVYQKFNNDCLTIDRFTPSVWVYDFLRGIDKTRDIFEIENKMNMFDCSLVLCYCNPNIARSRVKENMLREHVFAFEDELIAFKKYENISSYKSIILINTEKSIDECVKEIVDKI